MSYSRRHRGYRTTSARTWTGAGPGRSRRQGRQGHRAGAEATGAGVACGRASTGHHEWTYDYRGTTGTMEDNWEDNRDNADNLKQVYLCRPGSLALDGASHC